MLSQWFSTCLPSLLELQHRGCTPTTCHLSGLGYSFSEPAPPALGAWSGGAAAQVALGLKWRTGEPGRAGWALTWVPAIPDQFITDTWRLNELGAGNAQASARDLLNALNAITLSDGSTATVGTVHRSSHGAPALGASFAPYQSVQPVLHLATCRRRLQYRGGLSPS